MLEKSRHNCLQQKSIETERNEKCRQKNRRLKRVDMYCTNFNINEKVRKHIHVVMLK